MTLWSRLRQPVCAAGRVKSRGVFHAASRDCVIVIVCLEIGILPLERAGERLVENCDAIAEWKSVAAAIA